jgi:hypothetical protein
MKTRVLLLGLLGLVVAFSGLTAFAAEKPLEGTITSAAGGKLSVRAEGQQYTFLVSESAKCFLDDKECKFSDLKAGHRAKVTWEKKGADQIATKIEARSKAENQFRLDLVAAEKPLEGTITSAAAGKLAVRADGEQYNFTVADDARMFLDGKECKLTDLKAGQSVKVTWEKKGDAQLATRIDAKSKANRTVSFNVAFLADDDATHEGTVTSAANNNLAMKVNELQHNFTVDSSTKITLDGQEAKFSDLKAGHKAKVTSIKQGDKMLAKTITARSK